jgi:hypothetical protein
MLKRNEAKKQFKSVYNFIKFMSIVIFLIILFEYLNFKMTSCWELNYDVDIYSTNDVAVRE